MRRTNLVLVTHRATRSMINLVVVTLMMINLVIVTLYLTVMKVNVVQVIVLF